MRTGRRERRVDAPDRAREAVAAARLPGAGG